MKSRINFHTTKNFEHIVKIEPQESVLKVTWTKNDEDGWNTTTLCNYVASN